ncbi:MAG: recombinase XerD, partial [Planctomycetia bacterium]|nr:recombinase XerD [Planctomycetia bacterium]
MASVFKHGGKGNRDGYYYVAWRDHRGKRHTKCTRTTDKAAAERIAAKYETDAALRRDGVIDPMLDDIGRQSQRPLSEHIADYKAKLQSAGRTAVHTDRTTKYIKAFAAFCKFDRAADITADGAHQYAQSLTDKQRSARTVQAHLTAAKGFTKWLSKGQKLLRDPLESVSTPSPEADRSFERRILLPEEWYWLRANTSTSATRQGMAGAERVLLYSVAIQTGLRSGELRSLTRGRLFLSEDRPYIVCKARSTKNRKDARQYIQRPLAAELQSHVATKAPGGPLFVLPAEDEMASMLRADLADARRAWLKETLHDPEEYTRRE